MWSSEGGKVQIKCWLDHLECPSKIKREEPAVELFTDTSHLGWGAHTKEEQKGAAGTS